MIVGDISHGAGGPWLSLMLPNCYTFGRQGSETLCSYMFVLNWSRLIRTKPKVIYHQQLLPSYSCGCTWDHLHPKPMHVSSLHIGDRINWSNSWLQWNQEIIINKFWKRSYYLYPSDNNYRQDYFLFLYFKN